MPLQPCAKEPFVGTQQFEIPYSTTIIKLARNIEVTPVWRMTICRRPATPIWGVTLNGVSGGYDFVTSTQANVQAIMDVIISCYTASINFVQDNAGVSDIYESGEYGDYLYRKLNSAECLTDRFKEVTNKTVQFFTLHPVIALFDLPLYKELTELTSKIMRESDKQMFIPPGVYKFIAGSIAQASLEAWVTADPTFQRFYGIELVTT